ncbi:hypothetical protein CBOM_08042 [Ceraceosorus bombacis]|uniref:Uncharacterized protein n=1 Tax=Ceraceosorus bombacis TaxID=401625 RepID=A0A0N7LAG9_9BASI|nr:hypothetical protein CBOM_08042 [Ceraceosorus bombacis]
MPATSLTIRFQAVAYALARRLSYSIQHQCRLNAAHATGPQALHLTSAPERTRILLRVSLTVVEWSRQSRAVSPRHGTSESTYLRKFNRRRGGRRKICHRPFYRAHQR